MATLIIRDKFGEILETKNFNGSLVDWLRTNVKSYRDTIRPPYSAQLNGNPWPYDKHSRALAAIDVVDLTIEPQEPVTIIFAVISLAAATYAYSVASNIPKGYQNPVENGESIYRANTRVNAPKPSQIIREAAGTYPIFPDLICPPRRKFIDHEEYLYLMMSVSSGYMFLQERNVYIAETPITNYAGDYTLNIYDPGETVSGNKAHENWFESREVLELKLVTSTNTLPGNWTATYSGNTITCYLDEVLEAFPFEVGATIELLTGSNQGVYRVDSIGSPNHTATVTALDREDSIALVARSNNTPRAPQSILSGRRVVPPSRGINRERIGYVLSTASPSTNFTSVSPAEPITWRALNGGINWEGPFEVVPANETTRYIECDVAFPGGLVFVDDNNEQQNTTVQIQIQYREVGSDTWITAVDTSRSPNTTSYTDNNFDERGYTVEIDMGSAIRPEVRFRRVTKDAESINMVNDVVIRRVRCLLETPTSYSDVTTMALIFRGTNALATTSENKINIKGAVRKLPTLSEIQDAAGGTAFDISAANTQSIDKYNVNNSATFLGAQDVVNSDWFPVLSTISRNSAYITGTNMLTYEEGVLRWFTLSVSDNPTAGITYNAYSFLASSTKSRNAMYADSGSKMVVMQLAKDPGNTTSITQYDLSSNYDVSTATANTDYLAGESEILDGISFYMNDAGTAFWIADKNDGTIYQYTNSTPYDFSTGAQDTVGSPAAPVSFDTSTQLAISSPSSEIRSFWLGDYSGNDPQRLWMMDSNGLIYQYDLSTPGDISTAIYDDSCTIATQVANAQYMQVYSGYLHVIGTSNSESFVHSWNIGTIIDSRESKSIVRFAVNALYDALGSDVEDTIDWTALEALDTTLEARSDYFNGEFVDETTLWDALKVIFAPGYSEPAMKEGKLTAIRTTTGTDYSHLYTPDVMTGSGLLVDEEFWDGQDPDGVDVEYLNEDTGENEVIECRLFGDLGIRPKRILSIGITNQTRAWRYGMRERRRIFYKPNKYIFTTEMDALNSEYGDAIGLASDIFGAQSGQVTAASGNTLTLDFTPTFDVTTSPNPTYYAAFKKPDGEFSGLFTIIGGSPNNTITITDSPGIDFTPVTDSSPDSDGENTMVVIGTSDEWGVRAIIKRISPQGEDRVRVIAEEYVADIYADDNNSPP